MASEASALEELHSELTCPVCLELFREPVILECGHHFCRQCISQCWDAKPEESPSCPQCRKTCTAKLRPNSLLCNVVDSVRRAREMDTHSLSRERTQKAPASASGPEPSPERDHCEEHEEKLKLFCEDDQVAICLVCGMSRDHKTHSVIPINEAFDNYKEKLSAALQKVQLQMEEASRSQAQTNQKMMEIKEQAGALEEQIGWEFRQLREFLEQEEQEVKNRLRREKEERLRMLDESLQRTAEQVSQLELAAEQLRAKLREEENPAQLRGIKSFISGAEALFQRPPEVSTDLQPGQFVGPLQYKVWRKMGSILQPAVAPLTLDPNTAYPRLTVSPCQTSVRVGEIQPNLPDNPERFTRYNIVLGSQGFSSGRHYWEVEVGEKTAWGLGLATESVNRKEEISLCPEDGFWTLVLRNGDEYEACTDSEHPLSLTRKPRRVGVYLDYPHGQVAFYDAGDMTHLFTFSDTFTERVYPYFNPWPIINGRNREPLTIVTPRL
ncbi:zinc-binding protein A33-like [Megalops cyprinoides]|uniref:zinc-binding protein A33-like n=1 Tax=Megalops cyprinoides TaxID=118141 RepID=UPI001864EE05|nr:zinc-binding protein A33-like [Megalops cyprinoides]